MEPQIKDDRREASGSTWRNCFFSTFGQNLLVKNLLFSTRAYAYLADELALHQCFEQGLINRQIFPDGEIYHRLDTEVENRKVVLIGGTIDDANTMELYDLAQGIIHAGARSLDIVIPYFGYATMEREVLRGEIVKAKNRAQLFSALPPCAEANRVFLMDLHSEGIPYYFDREIRCRHLYCKEVILQSLKELGGQDFILASTDAGRAKWVESLANDLHVRSAFVYKQRLSGSQTTVTGVNADVQNKTVVIYDDMIRTGGSLLQAAQAYREAGAGTIYAVTTHGLFTNQTLARIESYGLIRGVIATNTHPLALQQSSRLLQVKSVAAIIFDGLNGTHGH